MTTRDGSARVRFQLLLPDGGGDFVDVDEVATLTSDGSWEAENKSLAALLLAFAPTFTPAIPDPVRLAAEEAAASLGGEVVALPAEDAPPAGRVLY